jgi:alpha-tubulin suppressor-like RCC1 family protein
VALSSYRTVGLKADGTVVATGSNHWGACNTSDWHDIVSVATGINFTAGLKSDGTVVLVGRCSTGESPTKDWQNVCQIAASSTMLVGITEEGSLLMAGAPSNWNQSYTYSSAEWTNLKTD